LTKLDRFEVFTPAELIRNPLAGAARVIQVEHRGHGIHAQAVDVKLLEPEKRVAEEKRPHLVAAVIEDQRAPVLMFALARIRMLVERGAVELREAVAIFGEVTRDPVENHARARGDDTRRRNSGNRPACRTGWSAQKSR
jgi:hypothetical protein